MATDLEMQATQAALHRIQKATKRDQEPDENGVYQIVECVECGADIEEGRLEHAIHNTVCIGCMTAREHRARR